MIIRYDEFDDGVIAPFWTQENGPVEQNGVLWIEGANPGPWVTQVGVDQSFDVWSQINLAETPDVDHYVALYMEDQAFTGYASIDFIYTDAPGGAPQHWIRAWRAIDTPYSEDTVYIDPDGALTVWLRLAFNAVSGRANLYYSLTRPGHVDDWIEVFPTVDPVLDPTVDVWVGSGTAPGVGKVSKVHYFREWGEDSYGARCRGRQVNFSKTAPTKVSDMKDGEMRVTPVGVYARIGDQILYSFADVLLPYFLDCGVTGNYFELHQRSQLDTDQWDMEGTEDTHWKMENDELVKIGADVTPHWNFTPGGGIDTWNKKPFVLPLIHVDMYLEEVGASNNNNFLLEVSDTIQGPGDKLFFSYLNESTGELYIRAEGPSSFWTWNGSSWAESSVVSTGVTWGLNEWWSFDVERNASGQWRIVIKNASDVAVVTTDWKDWRDAEFEEGWDFGGNASNIVIGYNTSGPGGNPKGRYKNFSCCTGMRRFAYSDFSFTTPVGVDNWLDVTSVGAGGTLNIPDTNYRLTFAMNGKSGVASEITGVMPFGNTGVSDLDEFDVWAQLHLDSSLGADNDNIVELLLSAYNTGATHEAGLRLRYGTPNYRLEYRAKDATQTDDWTEVVQSNDIWVRMRWLPSLGDTRIRLYYSTTDPESVYPGWTEIIPATANPNMSNLIQTSGAELAIRGYNDSASPFTHWIEFLKDARRTSFIQTTTTTTTTT